MSEIDTNSILIELSNREPIFHHPVKFGTTKTNIEAQMCDEFWEVGASGNVYTRQDIITTLLERYADPTHNDVWKTSDFVLTKISVDTYLLTYTLIQNLDRHTRRATIWKRINGNWKILYHQGTIVHGEGN